MATKINLTKGQKVALDNSMQLAYIGLGWDVNRYDSGAEHDLDASAFLLGENGKLLCDDDFVFYNNLVGRDGAVVHTGDEREGGNDGDDEVILIDFRKIPSEIKRIAICVTIHDAEARRQNFGQISNAYIRIADLTGKYDAIDDVLADLKKEVDVAGDESVLRFDLEEDFSIETALVTAEIYNKNGEWKFNAVAAGYQGGLAAICRSFGANV